MTMNTKNMILLSSTDEDLSNKLKKLITVHPNYEIPSHMTGFYFSQLKTMFLGSEKLVDNIIQSCDGLKLDGANPAMKCLVNAIDKFGKSLALAEKNKIISFAHERMKLFLIDLLFEFVRTCNFRVTNLDTGAQWETLCDLKLSDINKDSAAKFSIESIPLSMQIVTKAYDKLVPQNIKLSMQRFNHEDAIVDCVLDHSTGVSNRYCVNS